MKVLILPSWYPNTDTKFGSFFKEQASFLNAHGYDVKILMAEELHTKNYLFHYLKRLLTGKRFGLNIRFLDQNPEAYSFPLIIQKDWSEAKQLTVAKSKYVEAFKLMLKTGWKPDVIHVQGTFKAGFSAQEISKQFQLPYVIIEHSPFNIGAYSVFKQEQIRSALLHAKKVAGVSNYQKKRMLDEGIERPIEVVWNLMDEEVFMPTPCKSEETNSKFVITTITRPTGVKDVDTFFKAVSNFVSRLPNKHAVEIVVVGHASLKDIGANTDYFDSLVATYKLEAVCSCIPFLTRKEINHLMHRTNVFVSTSLDEPYGVAIREAMLHGKPVITTKSGGPEDSINSLTGVLVEKGDYSSIANYLMAIFNKELIFDSQYIREHVICQSGRAAFLKSMNNFYNLDNE